MAKVGIIFGLLLCGLTVVGLVYSSGKSPFQFIPMMLGIPVLFLGVVALNPHRRKHSIQVVATIAGLGALVGGGRSLYMAAQWIGGESINMFAFKMVVAMSLTCLGLLLLCVASFLTDRQRGNGESSPAGAGVLAGPAAKGAPTRELEGTALGPK